MRFLAVGVVAALVNILSRIALNYVMSYEVAIVVAYVCGMTTAYVLNKLFVFSPSGRAAAFAVKHGLQPVEDFADAAAAADVVITCTADAVVHADAFVPGRRVLVIDLGLPRNVDPAVGHVDGVELLDLETIRLHAPLEEFSAHADARIIVGDAAAEFAADRAAADQADANLPHRLHADAVETRPRFDLERRRECAGAAQQVGELVLIGEKRIVPVEGFELPQR